MTKSTLFPHKDPFSLIFWKINSNNENNKNDDDIIKFNFICLFIVRTYWTIFHFASSIQFSIWFDIDGSGMSHECEELEKKNFELKNGRENYPELNLIYLKWKIDLFLKLWMKIFLRLNWFLFN